MRKWHRAYCDGQGDLFCSDNTANIRGGVFKRSNVTVVTALSARFRPTRGTEIPQMPIGHNQCGTRRATINTRRRPTTCTIGLPQLIERPTPKSRNRHLARIYVGERRKHRCAKRPTPNEIETIDGRYWIAANAERPMPRPTQVAKPHPALIPMPRRSRSLVLNGRAPARRCKLGSPRRAGVSYVLPRQRPTLRRLAIALIGKYVLTRKFPPVVRKSSRYITFII